MNFTISLIDFNKIPKVNIIQFYDKLNYIFDILPYMSVPMYL